ncbi:DUF1015 domain-containing protein [Myroides sp. 1354]|uniref:DUF1015 domain-containing protein n=1 Tax=unclassified Myroides TaxID=2642485 RepID=UPI002575F6F7|nr:MULTISPECIES: DUF1015 domain-containing protein [unclassified Myroides]MDM1046226.1 DUF1015 domain-containing protein [Myroides sp. R163-1]MDM1057162.1 DUF1015 domain-containing protein [Myroides sp. 1354]MDM1070357.1 DUF1015 domain-containing protein [Myroides sp. 1372]
MAKIIPFQGIRPTRDKANLVTCRSFEDYNAVELAYLLDYNPFSFLHVLNPAYVNPQKVTSDKRFKMVAAKFNDFKREGILTKEENPVLYLYQIETKNWKFTGIVAGTCIEDYENNIIKKHEDTLEYRVNLFKEYLYHSRFNTEPVLMMYPDKENINAWIAEYKENRPIYDFTTVTKERHTIWKVDDQACIDWICQEFDNIPELYIADGHHRFASAALLKKENGFEPHSHSNTVMTFLIAENNIKIYEFNRIIHDLNNHTKEEFLALLSEKFTVKNKQQQLWKPSKKMEFGMYLDGDFYSLKLKDKIKTDDILLQLDAQILYDAVLNPILGLDDLRNDARIDYIPGNESIVAIKELVDDGEYEVGFMLYPTNVQEIKLVADNDLIMPPKSTYIEPKFMNGLLTYEI